MRSLLPVFAAALLSMTAACSGGKAAESPTSGANVKPGSGARDVAKANEFNFAMYGALRAQQGNLFFSATSMREALGIAYLGARGATASEMATAMRLDPDAARAADYARTEITDFDAARGSASLSIANRLWGDASYHPKASFTSLASQSFGAGLEPLDFKANPDGSRKTINGWVAKQTNDKIQNLLQEGTITPATRMVITNAIWFKGNWASAFDPSLTYAQDFHVDGKAAAQKPMMHKLHDFSYVQANGAAMLELKYEKSDLAMDVLLPDTRTGLGALEAQVVTSGIDGWTSGLHSQKVEVALPKLTMTWGDSIREPLLALGMRTAFLANQADLTGIADPAAAGGPLYVSDVIHKAFVAIDEKGTEAAAATAVVSRAAAAAPAPGATFVADHPYLFVIRDVKQNRILFMGRVTDPA